MGYCVGWLSPSAVRYPFRMYRRFTLEDLHDMAAARGGTCLSPELLGGRVKHRWRCVQGHEWEADPAYVRLGHWCAVCGGVARLTLADLQATAAARGGSCLSTEALGALVKRRWRCAKGHEWEAVPYNVRRGYWCPTCGKADRLRFQDLHAAAAARGGSCLSRKSRGSHVKLSWRCAQGHEWKDTPASVLAGAWCPICQGLEAPSPAQPDSE